MKHQQLRVLHFLLLLALALALLTGCASLPAFTTSGAQPPAATVTPNTHLPTATTNPGAQPLAATPRPPAVRHLTILYTNDEHGWIAPQKQKDGSTLGGAAELLGRWRTVEGYTPDGPFLILSGGDMWTGPAISSWFHGDSAAEVMNQMGYRAAAIGNHEFDFGLDVLRRHAQAANFPYLSANLVRKDTGQTPDFAQPFTLVTVNGIRVGIIGLTTTATPYVTNPRNIADFDFLPYAGALQRYVPQVKVAGADLIVVLAHVCGDEMRALAPQAKALGVDVLTAGHCHERIAEKVAGLPLIEGGKYMQSYDRLDLDVDVTGGSVVESQAQVVDNRSSKDKVTPDPAVARIVAQWQVKTEAALGEVIGYTQDGLGHRTNALFNLVTDAWLWAYPTNDFAVTNRGGFRQGIDPGPITLGDIVGVLPFEDTLVEVTVTGEQLEENLDCCGGVVGGMTYLGNTIKLPGGQPIDPKATYHVLINSFMASGGDSYRFGQQDPHAYDTATNWRQPVIDYIKHLNTSQANPLEDYLDSTARMDP